MYIATGQGQKTTGDEILMSTETSLSLWSFATMLKKISLKSDFIHFFSHVLIHVYSQIIDDNSF